MCYLQFNKLSCSRKFIVKNKINIDNETKSSSNNNFLGEIWNLEEGIDGWSRYIDPSIPRY